MKWYETPAKKTPSNANLKSFGFDFQLFSWICTTLCLGGMVMSFFNSFGMISFQVSFWILLNKIVIMIFQFFLTQSMFGAFVKKTSVYCLHNSLYIITYKALSRHKQLENIFMHKCLRCQTLAHIQSTCLCLVWIKTTKYSQSYQI